VYVRRASTGSEIDPQKQKPKMLQIVELFGKRLFRRPMFFEVAMHELCIGSADAATAADSLGFPLLEMEK
jgi:hypothetical protein